MDDNKSKTQKENEDRVAEEYLSSLADLNCNSKPLINMLTMLAEENIEYAPIIVRVVEQHIHKVPPDYKLSILYLIDSIVKNVKGTYIQLFSQCIVNIFCGVFERANEKVRERMYSLRQTWNDVFSIQKLYTLDVKIKQLDQNWPITAKITQPPAIHVNPNFLKSVGSTSHMPSDMDEILQAKTRALLELKTRKLELELEATKRHLEEQEKLLSKGNLTAVGNMLPPAQHVEYANVQSQILAPTNHMMGMRQTGMHQANFRNPRPQVMFPNNNVRQPRVHPVNPTLLNSMRHRDPRLARQQQQQEQQQQQHHQMQSNQNSNNNNNNNNNNRKNQASQDKETSSTSRSNSSSSTLRRKGNRNSKSPSRSYSGRSSSSRSESSKSHSSKSSSKDKQRSHSGSSSGSSSSKKNSSVRSDRHSKSHSRSVEKDNAEKSTSNNGSNISPNKSKDGLSNKRTSSGSIKSSPSTQRHKTRSRSNSPSSSSKLENDEDLLMNVKPAEKRHKLEDHKISTLALQHQQEQQSDKSSTTNSSMGSSKDLDKTNSTKSFQDGEYENFGHGKGIALRIFVPITLKPTVATTLWNENTDENDLLCSHSSNNDNNYNLSQKQQQKQQREIVEKYKVAREDTENKHLNNVNASATTTANNTTPFINRVSFRINNKKLEKSTENFSTAFTGSLSSSLAASLLSAKNSTTSLSAIDKKDNEANKQIMDIDGEDDDNDITNYDDDEKNKRKSTKLANDEPAIKKSKQINKIDALFGDDDDVDMQKTNLPVKGNQNEDWTSGNKKRSPISPKKSPTVSSNLDDVRAKLAKAAKFNKMGKTEKTNRDLTQRLKLNELNVNEDSLDANDEKIRTILTQAQELLETKSINQEQYRNLLQTVMSINETNKLKEAKRRESLKTSRSGGNKQQHQKHSEEDDDENSEDAYERERLAAREAILKKRIPKISKNSNNKNNNNNNNGATDSPRSDTGNSPLYDDATDAMGHGGNVESINRRQQHINSNNNSNNNKNNKRQKPSKWGERIDVPIGQRNWSAVRPTNMVVGSQPQRMNFRNNLPPPSQPNNLRMAHFTPFQNNNQQPQITQPPPLLLRSNIPPPPQPPLLGIRLPAPAVAAAKPCNSIDNPQADLVRSITIDGQSKEIRIYGAVAIVFMDLDQPREIGFKHGQRAVVIDNGEPILLKFNDVYKPVNIAGALHQMRFGFPSRELYIDEHWYEIYFGGAPVQIPINGKMHLLTAEGPPPQVHIGPLRRDLVVGKINMIVDALIVIPLFLDAHLQSFQLDDNPHTIQFADNLLTVLIDGEITKVEYGGLPKSYTLGGKKYFIRFGALPQGVVAGKVRIKDMIYVNEIAQMHDLLQNEALSPVSFNDNNLMTNNTNTISTGTAAAAAAPPPPPSTSITINALGKLNIDDLFQKLVSTGIFSGNTKPVAENLTTKTTITEATNLEVVTQDSSAITAATAIAASEENEGPAIIPIDLSQPESIKTRQQGIINILFNGMQCSSCGVRFPPEQTIKYSQHLDWHFRQNRRERDSARKAHSRKWYYSLADWMQYKEIEDIEEREKNYFESQQQLDADEDDSSSNTRAASPEPTCAAGPDDVDRACDMCHEKFEQFYNEELEEWHLRSAIRVEDKIYHPLCFDDFKASLCPPKQIEEKDESMANATDDNAMDVDIKMENTQLQEESSIIDDDDDDVIVLPNEEPTITELDDDDDDEYVPTNVTREEMGDMILDETSKSADDTGKEAKKREPTIESDADIEIQEPHIPFTDLDTYVEKVLPADANAVSPLVLVKIKEEPKDEDEDDGFEEVGTVLILPDEQITINSDDTQSQPLVSSLITTSENATSMSATEVDFTAGEATNQEGNAANTATATDMQSNNVAIDGNQEPEDKHNLSATGVSPAVVPLASLVNKIKINITKNINTSSASTANITTTTSSTNSAAGDTISSIPVLYGGATTISTHITGGDVDADDHDIVGATSSCLSPSLVPVEDTMTYELKPALQKANLKKTKKIETGVETSGLCSIM